MTVEGFVSDEEHAGVWREISLRKEEFAPSVAFLGFQKQTQC